MHTPGPAQANPFAELDDFNDPSPASAHLPAGERPIEDDDPLPPELAAALEKASWGALCLELLLEPENADAICRAYNTDPLTVENLLRGNEQFRVAFKEARDRVRSLGPNAGFTLRAQASAEQSLVVVTRLALDKTAPHAVRLRAAENLVNWGDLNPTARRAAAADKAQAGTAGVAMTFIFGPGLPGSPSSQAVTIDVDPTTAQQTQRTQIIDRS